MKALLLLLTLFFIFDQSSLADTLVMRDGRTLHGKVESFDELKLRFIELNGAVSKEFSLSQLQTLYFSRGAYNGTTGVDDQFCLDQLAKIATDKSSFTQSTLLRSIKNVDLSSPYTWSEEEVLTYYCNGLLPEGITTYSIDYNADYEQVEVIDASLITQQKRIVRLPDASFNKSSLYGNLPHLNRMMKLEVKLPEVVKGSLLNLRIRKVRTTKIPFSNFYIDHEFSSFLPVKRSELRVSYPDKAEWTLNSSFNTSAENIRYLHGHESKKVIKTWWVENLKTDDENPAIVSIVAQENSIPELITLYSKAIGNELLKLGNRQLLKKRSKDYDSVEQILADFSMTYIELPANGIHFDTDLITTFNLGCGTAEDLAILLINELQINGYKADLLMCRDEPMLEDSLFSFQLFDYPVVRIHGDKDIFVTPSGKLYDRKIPVYGYCVYGTGLLEKVTIPTVEYLSQQRKVKVDISGIEQKEGGHLHVFAELPVLSGHSVAHSKQLIEAFKALYPNNIDLTSRLSEDKKIMFIESSFEQIISISGEKELLMFDFPNVNSLIDAYKMFQVELELEFKIPVGYQVNILPVDLTGSVNRRFLPTSTGFQTFIYGGKIPKKISKLIVMKNEGIKK